MPETLPDYATLLSRSDAPSGSSWGLFNGETADLGTANLLTPDRVCASARLVRHGRVFNLDLPLDAIDPPISVQRRAIEHTVISNGTDHRDDYVTLYCQASSHIDGLRHVRDHEHGFYNGVRDEDAAVRRLGIDHWARHGLVGRGVVIDVPRYLESTGAEPLALDTNQPIGPDLLDAVLSAQGTERKTGDMLLLRTGWINRFINELTQDERLACKGALRSPGLEQSHDMVRWLWDSGVVAVVSDNPGVECFPPAAESPFNRHADEGAGLGGGLMHPQLIARLGMIVGELWWLDDLAADCAGDGVFEVMLMSKPLNLTGGVGSPANAVAIK